MTKKENNSIKRTRRSKQTKDTTTNGKPGTNDDTKYRQGKERKPSPARPGGERWRPALCARILTSKFHFQFEENWN